MLQAGTPVENVKLSPMETLCENFRQQNQQFEELIQRLRGKLHRLSDTNFPKEENPNKTANPELPFREGHLMYYHDQLCRNQMLLNELLGEVVKLESLI